MEQVDTKTIVQQFKDWEIQILVLLSFALQLLLFFFGGLRRRTSRVWLRVFLWLTYLSADFIAVYALGYLSRHLPTTTNDHICYQTCLGKTLLPSQSHHDFTLLWAPFFLVHLGGQDTVTAFAIEDNELWSRHLLNMIVQVCLVVYVMWYSMAHNLPVVPAAFLSVARVIKYGERIWALKCGSQESLKSSISSSYVAALKKLAHDEEDGIQVTKPASTVQRALKCMLGLREVFSRRQPSGNFSFEKSLDAQLTFKTAEMELSMMYDELYTKAKVIQTGKGTILRCVSLTSTVVAFVLFILMNGSKQRHGPVTDEMKELIHQEIDNNKLKKPLNLSPQLFFAQAASSFEETLFMMHLYTDMYLYKPAMLPVQRNVYDLLALVLNDAGYARASSKEQFLETVASGEYSWDQPFMDFRAAPPDDMLQQGWQGLHAALQVMVQVWVRLLIYAAGKSQHARRLSMGGELLTFVWLLMAHRELGDIYNIQFQLVEKEKDGSVRTGPNSTITTDIYTLFRLGHPIDMIK
ncbi:hypothetical protein OsI_19771 [Oryza sativa Indica Group]|uniref:DUF4220 domain-containing protein n=1 Tax=Oryza sativa subsp. indica TaxID=39946 RepID=B8AXR8_ORYSI|nr:hypothetical protein OsI_19771 [Oryza sativa Indica Group]